MSLLKVFFYSDPHGLSHKMVFPKADYYFCGGDITNLGTPSEFIKFNALVQDLKKRKLFKKFFLIPGNHDIGLEDDFYHSKSLLSDVEILIDQSVVLKGIKFHGSPYTPKCFDWAFMKSEVQLGDHWNLIPDDTHVLLSHGPSFLTLDNIPRYPFNVGSKTLRQKVDFLSENRNLILHLFGHIHEGRGVLKKGKTTFINGSSVIADPHNPHRMFGDLNPGYLISIDTNQKLVVNIEEVI